MSERLNRRSRKGAKTATVMALAAAFCGLAVPQASAESGHRITPMAITNYRSESVAVLVYQQLSESMPMLKGCFSVSSQRRLTTDRVLRVPYGNPIETYQTDIYAYPGTCTNRSSTAVLEKHGLVSTDNRSIVPVSNDTVWIDVR